MQQLSRHHGGGSEMEDVAIKKALIQMILSMSQHAANQQSETVENQHKQIASTAQARHPQRTMGTEVATEQQFPSLEPGIDIQFCGPLGELIENALEFGLGFIPGGSNWYSVRVWCPDPTYPCTTVTVAVPAGDANVKADIDVCNGK